MSKEHYLNECFEEIQSQRLEEFKRAVKVKLGEIIAAQRMRKDIDERISKMKTELHELELQPLNIAEVLK